MKRRFDVIVIGAGPAGSVVATGCAQAGLSTLIVEKKPQVGIPVICAEGIDTAALENHFTPRPPWIASRIDGGRLFGPNGEMAEVMHPRAGYVLERAVVDRDLAALAARSGATIWTGAEATGMEVGQRGVEVQVKQNGRKATVSGNVVVGADGIGSKVGRWTGLWTKFARNDITSCCQYIVAHRDISPGFTEFHVGNRVAPGGYIWVFPKMDGLANVGIAISPTKSQRGPRAYLDRFVQKIFPGASLLGEMWGAVPTAESLSPSFAQRVLLVGDAARLTDPLSGAGIANAFRSGALAAETIRNAFASGDFSANSLRMYEKRWKKKMGRGLSLRYRAKEIFLKLTDRELNEVIEVIKVMFAGKSLEHIDIERTIVQIVQSSPKLLRLAKHLF